MQCECQGHHEPHMQLRPQSLPRSRTHLLTADKKMPIDCRSLSKQEPVIQLYDKLKSESQGGFPHRNQILRRFLVPLMAQDDQQLNCALYPRGATRLKGKWQKTRSGGHRGGQCQQACSQFPRKLFWGQSATLGLTGPLQNKEALKNKRCMEKAQSIFQASLRHDHCTLGSQHSSLLYASFLDFSKNNRLHH